MCKYTFTVILGSCAIDIQTEMGLSIDHTDPSLLPPPDISRMRETRADVHRVLLFFPPLKCLTHLSQGRCNSGHV